jgi:hypothetical protein
MIPSKSSCALGLLPLLLVLLCAVNMVAGKEGKPVQIMSSFS